MKVLERYEVKGRGLVIVLDCVGKRGDVVRCGDQIWVVLGVETHAVVDPRSPFGFLLGASAPVVGDVVTLESAE